MTWPNETKSRLMRWGRWARGGASGIGYPTMAITERAKSGSGRVIGETNPELLRTDAIILQSELRFRRVLIFHFTSHGTTRQKAQIYRLPKSTYWDLLDDAVWYVHTEYDKVLENFRTSVISKDYRQLSVGGTLPRR